MISINASRRYFHSLAAKLPECPASPPDNPRISLHLIGILSSCNNVKSVLLVHCQLVVSGIRTHSLALSRLLSSYSSFGKCDLARRVFDSTQNRGLILWNSMLKAYTRSRRHGEALKLYRCMLDGGPEPDKYTFSFVLKACTGSLAFQEAALIHREVSRKGLECDLLIGTNLIDMYCKSGWLKRAGEVFDKIPRKDAAVWNAMIAGFSRSSDPRKALDFFRSMQLGGVRPSSVSLLALFPAVCRLSAIQLCRSIHGYVVRGDFSTSVANGMIDTYCKCGCADVARQMFDRMPNQTDISWGIMMAGYADIGKFCEVLELVDDMRRQSWKMNSVCAVSALKAAAETKNLEKGKEIHSYAMRQGIDSDVRVGTPIVTMYAKCGELQKAKRVFGALPGKDLVAWSALITACAQCGSPEEALSLFREMQEENLRPNRVTLMSALPASAELQHLNMGKSLHCYAVKNSIDSDASIATSLVSLYATCGSLSSAEVLFGNDFIKDVVAWNVMVAGYMQNGQSKEAISTFHQMRLQSFRPDLVTLLSVIPAVAHMAAIGDGMRIHACAVRMGFQSYTAIGNSVIDMYAKCGRLDYSERFFNEMEAKNTVSWNALLAGHAVHGNGNRAMGLFSVMEGNNVEADSVSFLSVLSACGHAGLIEEGRRFFHLMQEKHQLKPGQEHYACMVDLLGRAGRFDEAVSFIEEMLAEPDAGVWRALLGASRLHSNVTVGEAALNHLMKLEPRNPAHYVVLASLYAQTGRWIDAGRIRSMMRERVLRKATGCSWEGSWFSSGRLKPPG